MITDLIFDFFGTLVGYTHGAFVGEPYHVTHQLLLNHGFPIDYQRFVAEWEAVSAALEDDARQTHAEYHMRAVGHAFFARCFSTRPESDLIEQVVDAFVWEWNRGTVLNPATTPLLERLARRFRLSIISNTHYPALIHRNLAAMGAGPMFKQVVTSSEFGQRKPHPAIFAHALRALGIGPDAAMYIGDNPVDDIAGAAGAGLRAILIDPADRWPDVPTERISQLADLERLLD